MLKQSVPHWRRTFHFDAFSQHARSLSLETYTPPPLELTLTLANTYIQPPLFPFHLTRKDRAPPFLLTLSNKLPVEQCADGCGRLKDNSSCNQERVHWGRGKRGGPNNQPKEAMGRPPKKSTGIKRRCCPCNFLERLHTQWLTKNRQRCLHKFWAAVLHT